MKSAHDGCPKRLYDTLSSFSNQDSGGVIIFGLEETEDFACTGVYDLQDLQKSVADQCSQMEPPVRAVFTFAEVDGKRVASAEIPAIELSLRPCYYKGKGKYRGAYIRVGEADMPMTDYEVYSFEAFRQHVHDDERPIQRASMSDLDTQRLAQYIQENRAGRPGFSMLSEEQAREMLNITREGVPTLAALMNFGMFPQGFLPQLAITAIVIPGTEIGQTGSIGERFIDNQRIEGTIAEMVERSIAFSKRNMKTRTIIDGGTGERRDRTEYPITAIREAILNALIHRDYSSYTEGTPVQMVFFRDRLEIHSPGNLYGRMTVEQLGVSRPDLRNPALAVIAETQTEAENRYSGIPTMRREMKAFGLPEPKFENRRNEFVVTFYNDECAEGIDYFAGSKDPYFVSETPMIRRYCASEQDDAANMIVEYCRSPRSRQEIADLLGLKTIFYVTSRYIDPLVKEGKLKMTIPDHPKSKNQKFYT